MRYLYYPGCSLEGSAREYDLATRALLAAFDVSLEEIEDWSCCGASAAAGVSELLALALPARILALAERQNSTAEILVPCSACYLNLKTVSVRVRKDPETLSNINTALAETGLQLKGTARVRHLLEVLAFDLGPKAVTTRLVRPLNNLQIAPYYGCQCLRPYAVFDDPEQPNSMEPLIRATGAAVFDWAMGAKCCGASHMTTKPAVGIELTGAILQAARGADAVVTVCPMCQMNLEAYQKQAGRRFQTNVAITVLYLPQLLGLAAGIDASQLGLSLNLAIGTDFRQKVLVPAAKTASA